MIKKKKIFWSEGERRIDSEVHDVPTTCSGMLHSGDGERNGSNIWTSLCNEEDIFE